ncbi:MAG TPA: hypothetical protein VFA51_13505, partial [Candidatus Udaeobacter sp.]|nr:hypothetical protein [Candidatus Udaeobacter sp.]
AFNRIEPAAAGRYGRAGRETEGVKRATTYDEALMQRIFCLSNPHRVRLSQSALTEVVKSIV